MGKCPEIIEIKRTLEEHAGELGIVDILLDHGQRHALYVTLCQLDLATTKGGDAEIAEFKCKDEEEAAAIFSFMKMVAKSVTTQNAAGQVAASDPASPAQEPSEQDRKCLGQPAPAAPDNDYAARREAAWNAAGQEEVGTIGRTENGSTPAAAAPSASDEEVEINMQEWAQELIHHLVNLERLERHAYIIEGVLRGEAYAVAAFKRAMLSSAPLSAASGWIPVSERLPEFNTLVLAYGDPSHPDDVQLAWCSNTKFCDKYEWWVRNGNSSEAAMYITHWQPLPPPPGA